jgi:release factor glutamine methyltransferase
MSTGAHTLQTVGQVIVQTQAALKATLNLAPTEARIEAQILLRRAINNISRAWLIAHEHDYVAAHQLKIFNALLQRRLAGEPVAYILGEREFFGLMLKVTPDTLIPRPETELLVEASLRYIQKSGVAIIPSGDHVKRVLDLGTGCGAIALAIAHARPDVEVLAVDASIQTLAVAQENALSHGLSNLTFLQSNWFSALAKQKFDLVVSNPPYVAANDPHLQLGDLRFEPLSALASGADGLADIRHIVACAPAYLNPGGWVLLEHGYDQAAQVRELMNKAQLDCIFSEYDLGGIERITGGCSAKNLAKG